MPSFDKLIGKQLDQFRLDQFIARGAMGLVFKAFDTILIRTVALKLIPKRAVEEISAQEAASMEEARKRLIQEAKAAGRLSHPNIVTIHSYGETDEFEYICMEYVSGKTLAHVLNEQKVLPVEEAAFVFEQILLALEAAGKEQIVHRDIKPSNIMITDDRRVKVMDFGIAKLPSLAMTMTGTVLGTPYYMSPEQISGQKIDIRSDIFSVGAVLYECLTGERPFWAENTATLAYKIVQTDPVPPKVLNIRIPQQIGDIVSRAMAKEPAKRFQTPAEMLRELKAATTRKDTQTPDSAEATMILRVDTPEATVQVSREQLEQLAAGTIQPPSREVGPDVRETAAATGKAQPAARAPESEKAPEMPSAGAGAQKEPGEQSREAAPAKLKPAEKKAGEEKPLAETPPAPPPKAKEPEEPPRGKLAKKQGAPSRSIVGVVAVMLGVAILGGLLFKLLRQPAPNTAVTSPPATQETEPAPAQLPAVGDQAKATADSLVQQAKAQLQKSPANAQKLLEEAALMDPANLEASLQLARLLTIKKDYPAAIQQYQSALRLNKQLPEIYFNLGYIFLTQGDYDAAIENYEACWSLTPTYQDEVLTNLGIAYLRKNNPAQALSLFRQALELNPNNNVAKSYMTSLASAAPPSQPDATAQPTIPVIPPQPTPSPAPAAAAGQTGLEADQARASAETLVAQAKAQLAANPADAERLLQDAIGLDPNNFEAHLQMGRLLTFRKDYQGAIEHYQGALQINGQVPEVYFNLGFIYLNQRAYDLAKKNYEKCLAFSPSYKDEILTNLGIIELRNKNSARARQLFKEALDLNPNNNIARNYLVMLNKPAPKK